MRIVIDMQGAQANSCRPEADFNLIALTRAIVRYRKDHEVVLILSGLNPDTIDTIREEFYGILPQESIRVWYAAGTGCGDEQGKKWCRNAEELIHETFIEAQTPDVLLVTGMFDNCVLSVNRNLKKAELLLVTAEPVAPELVELLEEPPETVVNISGYSQDDSAKLIIEFIENNFVEGSIPQRTVSTAKLYDTLLATLTENESINAVSDEDIRACAWSIARILPPVMSQCQLLVDVSQITRGDIKTGVQRVVRALLRELLLSPPPGYEVRPVYATPRHQGYRYAEKFTGRLMNWRGSSKDEPIDFHSTDIFLGLDLLMGLLEKQYDYLKMLHRDGVKVCFVVYDLLPLRSGFFPQDVIDLYRDWLNRIMDFDGVVCISESVASELSHWRQTNFTSQGVAVRKRPFSIKWFHLGADIENSIPSRGFLPDAENVFRSLENKTVFLMVGTVEPRKGHGQVLAAFEKLWQQGQDLSLVIVGAEGWMVEEVIETITHHPELNKRLFWLQGISDEYLEKLYSVSSCLIAASEGEGFGLPLIEAAQQKLPVIARDIPVFREVAGEHAYFFSGTEAEALVGDLQKWLELNDRGLAPQSDYMEWQKWSESKQQLVEAILQQDKTDAG